MKKIINILASLAVLGMAASCAIEGADAFSTDPVAPVISAHNDILITEGTMDDMVAFTWEKARFINAAGYALHAVYGAADVTIADNINELGYRVSKQAFKDKILGSFDLPQNETHTLSFYVSVKDSETGTVYAGSSITLKVYIYEDAVAAVLSGQTEPIILDKENPSGTIALLSWEPARLTYNEVVYYAITACAGEQSSTVAQGLMETSYVLTVDELNEIAVAAGIPEEQAGDVTFMVTASCESLPDGIPSNQVTVNVTTYVATFPEMLYLPGSYQGWSQATAPTLKLSSSVKGQYEGFIDLSTEDGSNVLFKFSPKPAWEGDFAIDNIVVSQKAAGENTYAHVSGNGTTGGNIECPSGFYYIKISKKFNTLEMVQILGNTGLGLIGDFNSWGADVKMTWDAEKKTWTSEETDIKNGEKFKIRLNGQWDYSFGGTEDVAGIVFGGGNVVFDKPDGTYKFVLNVSESPFKLNIVDVNMPDELIIAGDYGYGVRTSTWSPSDQCPVYLKDSSKGIYKGYIAMYNAQWSEDGCEFKVTRNGNEWIGGDLSSETGGVRVFTLGSGSNMKVPFGVYYFEVDMLGMTVKTVPITKAGLIGSINGWSAMDEMTFNPAKGTYSITRELSAGDEFKFIFNDTTWTYELGLTDGKMIHGGGNIKVGQSGTYEIVLDLQGDNAPKYSMTLK